MSIDILKERIKKKEYAGVYFFYGQEEYTKDRYTELLRKCVTSSPAPEMNHIILNAADTTPDELYDSITTLPVMCDYKMVELRGITLSALKKDVLEGFADCFEDVPEDCVLLVFFRSGELDDETAEGRGRKNKTESGSAANANAFLKKLRECSLAVNFERETGERLIAWIKKHFSTRNVEIENSAVYKLTEVVGNSMYDLVSEIDKLALFYTGNAIKTDDVLRICCVNNSYRSYELADRVMRGDLYGAKRILDLLKLDKADASEALSLIARTFSDALLVVTGISDGVAYGEIEKTTGIAQRRISAIASSVRQRGEKALFAAVEQIYEADRRIKSSREDGFLIVETLISKICLYGK